MDQQLLSLATLAEQFEDLIITEAAAGLAKLAETKITPVNCPVDPIKKLKAAHSLRQNRERLHVFLSYSLTMEEFKSKFSPPEEYQNEIDAVIAKEKMFRFAKKRAALYTPKQRKSAKSPTLYPSPSAKVAEEAIAAASAKA
ncbi:hypothetical protein HDV01_000174 [Terramyces sp. JEL0728]|nr:hypothetical protein HDV01_000174 [Terramyces sp. JEL0728]